MKVLNEFKTHHYIEEWEKSELFCPNCGTQSVWEEQDDGDYYVGQDHICTSCDCNFSIQGPGISKEENKIKQIKQIKEGKPIDPTTPRGN